VSDVERIGAAIAGWFVRPAGARATERTSRRVPPIVEPVVLAGGDANALGVGAALALALARDGAAVVACWQVPIAERRRGGLATGRARRLAASLQARAVQATAAGRLVVVALPAEARDAVVLLRRVESACGGAICVPVLGGARGDEWDVVLAERGAAVLYGAAAAVLELAAIRLEEQGVQARVLEAAPGALARTLAVGGWTPPGARALRAAATVEAEAT
jgi:hypothetical protein